MIVNTDNKTKIAGFVLINKQFISLQDDNGKFITLGLHQVVYLRVKPSIFAMNQMRYFMLYLIKCIYIFSVGPRGGLELWLNAQQYDYFLDNFGAGW